jgi:hypothetical protein
MITSTGDNMVQGFEINLTMRQAQLMEYALRAHIKELTEKANQCHEEGDAELALELESSANVVRNTLAQVKDGLYGLFLKQEIV